MQEVRQLLKIRAPERVRRMQDKRQRWPKVRALGVRTNAGCPWMPERHVVERQDKSQMSVRMDANSRSQPDSMSPTNARQALGSIAIRRAQGVRTNARCTTDAKTESAWGAPRRVADQLQDEPKTSVSNAYPLPVVWLPRCFSLISLHRFPPLSSQSFSSCNWSTFFENAVWDVRVKCRKTTFLKKIVSVRRNSKPTGPSVSSCLLSP